MKIDVSGAALLIVFCCCWPLESIGQSSEMIDLRNQTQSLLTEIAMLKAENAIEKNTISKLREELQDHRQRIDILTDLLETSQGMLGEELAKVRLENLRTREALCKSEMRSGANPSFDLSKLKIEIAKIENESGLGKGAKPAGQSKTESKKD